MRNENEKCANCKYCKPFYVPPCYHKVIEAVGGSHNAFICNVFEDSWAMYLSDNHGFCEMFTERIHPLPFEDESEDQE